MLKILGDFTPYGKEFISTYPHLAECSQSNSTRSLKTTDFTKLLEQQHLRRTTAPPPQVRTEQPYQLSSASISSSNLSTIPTPLAQTTSPVDEELYIQNNTVIWSRGRHIIKTFQYELQSVEMVLFAWFPIDLPEHNDNMVSIDQLITNRKRKATLDSKATVKRTRLSTLSFTDSLLEAEQQSKYKSLLDHSSMSSPPSTQKDASSDESSNNNNNKLQKAACIILKDCVKVHFIDGQHHSIHLPFTVQHVIPSDIGLILERANQYNATATSHKSKNKDPFASGYPETSSLRGGLSVSPFLCLVHPADEFKPIFFLDQLSMSSTSLFDNGDSFVNFFQEQQLVYASFTLDHRNDSHESLPTLVVTKSKSTGLHSIWRYQTAKGGIGSSSSGGRDVFQLDLSDDEMMLDESKSFFLDTPSFHLDTRSQQLRQPKQGQTDTRRKQGRRSKKAPFSVKGNKRRQRQQKQQQVSPDSPFGGGGNNNSSIMYHSPSPTPSLTTRKDSFLAGSRSFIQADEDPSTLSMIFPGDNNSMLALYQDALDDNYGEKCQLQHLWTEERRPHLNPMAISRGFLSHNAKGLLVLCIMNETEGILLGLVVKDLLDSKHNSMHSNQLVEAFQIDAKQALPIYNATRSGNVADILLLDHQNNLSIFIDAQLPCLPILFSSKKQQCHIRSESQLIKIHDAVDNRFNLVIMDKDNNGVPGYRTKRCQIDDITVGEHYSKSSNRILVIRSSMALRCAWASSTLWNFFQHQSLQLQYQQKDRVDGWQVFVTTLLCMIPLAPLSDVASSSSSTYFSNGTNDKTKLGGLYENCMTKAYALQTELQNNNMNYYITEPQNIALVIRALHVLYQDYHLSKFFSKSSVNLLGTLLWLLARIARSSAWINCYRQYEFSLEANVSYQLDTTLLQQDHRQELSPTDDGLISLDRPFMFESWMHYHLPQNLTASLPQLCGLPTLDPESPQLLLTKEDTPSGIDVLSSAKIHRRHNEFGFKLKMIWYILQTMYFHLSGIEEHHSSNLSPPTPLLQSSTTSPSSRLLYTARQGWIEAIVKKGYCRNDLEMVPDTCILLSSLWNTLAHLRMNPPINQAMDFYRFIGRNDIVAQLDRQQVSSVMNNAASLSTCDLKSLSISLDKKNDHQQNISQLIAPSTVNYTGLPSGSNTVQARSPSFYQSRGGGDLNLSRFLHVDRASTLDTLKHVRIMLNPCHLVEMTVPDQTGIPDESLEAINQGYLKDVIQRTLALSIGNGIFHYGHQHSSASGLLPSLPPSLPNTPNALNTEINSRSLTTIEETINLSAKLLPLRRTITWNDQAYRPEYLDWPRFHHGVATALRLSSPRLSLFSKSKTGHGLAAPSKPRMASSNSGDYFSDGYLDDDDDKNDLSWLFYVEPEELNVFHGGLLFGLGLNGHLLPNLHWYRYITQSRCSLVTIGFILATCVTYRGSKNTDIIKILSVHVPSLVASQTASVAATAASTSMGGGVGASLSSSGGRMPGKDDDLMTSSCLFGLGLIFMGSCDRYMTTVMLNEIGNCSKRANANCGSGLAGDPSFSGTASSPAGHHGGGRPTNNMESACALAAGFALGFIMLGKGGSTSKELGGLPDAQLFDTLYNYMTGKTTNANHTKPSAASESTTTPTPSSSSGSSSPQLRHREHKQQQGKGTQVHYSQGTSSLLDITTPAATIALGLAYLKTENRRIADRLDISDTTKPYLNYVRPDFLLLRVVAKNLILWQSITPSQDWIDSHLPSFMHPSQSQQQGHSDNHGNHGNTKAFDDTLDGMDEQVINQAKYNIIAGACLCLGLRFAGSQDTKAFNCLLDHMDTFLKLAVAQATTFQDHITRSAVWVCIDVIATAAAMVMAGSGNEELYKRLKILHDRIPFGGGTTGNGKYSNHMASHMAMGLLFCGLGRYTLKTTNEAIAGLLCSFYPFYPIDPEDQRSHLQAFRHLWVMGLDQRWLTPFDCDTKQLCQVPLLLTIRATSSSDDAISMDEDDNSILQDKVGRRQGQQHEYRVVAPSVVPNYDTLARIQVDSSLYYPLNINMQIKGDYQQAIRQSGILFVQRKK